MQLCIQDIFICILGTQAKIQGNIQIIMLDSELQQSERSNLAILFIVQTSVFNKYLKAVYCFQIGDKKVMVGSKLGS